jgi:hypothetical protein
MYYNKYHLCDWRDYDRRLANIIGILDRQVCERSFRLIYPSIHLSICKYTYMYVYIAMSIHVYPHINEPLAHAAATVRLWPCRRLGRARSHWRTLIGACLAVALRALTAARECGTALQIELQARRARGERLSPAEDQMLLENCVQPLQVRGRALGTA